MTAALRRCNRLFLSDLLHGEQAPSRQLMLDIIARDCRHFPSVGHDGRYAHIMGLIDAEAWTDAALALVAAELPMWQIRRIVYDEGEWHCALSRERELPDWLDAAVEARHADLALALLSAFAEVKALAPDVSRPSVPRFPGCGFWSTI